MSVVWRVVSRLIFVAALLAGFLVYGYGQPEVRAPWWAWAWLTIMRLCWIGPHVAHRVPGFGVYVRAVTALDAIVVVGFGVVTLEILELLSLPAVFSYLSPAVLGRAARDYAAIALLLSPLFSAPMGLRADTLLPCCSCGYCLVGNVTGVCPECGQPVQHTASARQADRLVSGLHRACGPAVFKPWFRSVSIILVALGSALYLVASWPGERLPMGLCIGIFYPAMLVVRLSNTIGRADVRSAELTRRLRRYAQVVVPVDALLVAAAFVVTIDYGEGIILWWWDWGDLLIVWFVLVMVWAGWFAVTHFLLLRKWLVRPSGRARPRISASGSG